MLDACAVAVVVAVVVVVVVVVVGSQRLEGSAGVDQRLSPAHWSTAPANEDAGPPFRPWKHRKKKVSRCDRVFFHAVVVVVAVHRNESVFYLLAFFFLLLGHLLMMALRLTSRFYR